MLSLGQLNQLFVTQFSYLGNVAKAYSLLTHVVGRIIRIVVMDVKDAFIVINSLMLAS